MHVFATVVRPPIPLPPPNISPTPTFCLHPRPRPSTHLVKSSQSSPVVGICFCLIIVRLGKILPETQEETWNTFIRTPASRAPDPNRVAVSFPNVNNLQDPYANESRDSPLESWSLRSKNTRTLQTTHQKCSSPLSTPKCMHTPTGEAAVGPRLPLRGILAPYFGRALLVFYLPLRLVPRARQLSYYCILVGSEIVATRCMAGGTTNNRREMRMRTRGSAGEGGRVLSEELSPPTNGPQITVRQPTHPKNQRGKTSVVPSNSIPSANFHTGQTASFASVSDPSGSGCGTLPNNNASPGLSRRLFPLRYLSTVGRRFSSSVTRIPRVGGSLCVADRVLTEFTAELANTPNPRSLSSRRVCLTDAVWGSLKICPLCNWTCPSFRGSAVDGNPGERLCTVWDRRSSSEISSGSLWGRGGGATAKRINRSHRCDYDHPVLRTRKKRKGSM